MTGRMIDLAKKVAAVFSALVMLEIIIMISPFALYWYSLYSPTLQAIHHWPATAWLGTFVLPHSVITQSAVLEWLRWGLGPYLFSLGLWGFLLLATQVYIAKFRKRGIVITGVYRYVRHPQYVCLSVAGIGLLIYWPRMIIVLFYLVMVTAYYFLARSEEQRLVRQYPEYAEYAKRTAMFVPGNLRGRFFQWLFGWTPNGALARGLAVVTVAGLGLALSLAFRAYTIASAETIAIPEANVLGISGWPQGQDHLEKLITRALHEKAVREDLAAEGAGSYTAHLLPLDYGMMNMFTDLKGDRQMWSGKRVRLFARIVLEFLFPFTVSDVRAKIMGSPTESFRLVFSRVDGPGGTPLPLSQVTDLQAQMTAIAVVDLEGSGPQITKVVLDPPRQSFWGDIPMPMF